MAAAGVRRLAHDHGEGSRREGEGPSEPAIWGLCQCEAGPRPSCRATGGRGKGGGAGDLGIWGQLEERASGRRPSPPTSEWKLQHRAR